MKKIIATAVTIGGLLTAIGFGTAYGQTATPTASPTSTPTPTTSVTVPTGAPATGYGAN